MSTFLYTAMRSDEILTERNRIGVSRPSTVRFFGPAVAGLRFYCDALCEGLAAHRRYEHLRSWRVPHDTALRHALLQSVSTAGQEDGGQV